MAYALNAYNLRSGGRTPNIWKGSSQIRSGKLQGGIPEGPARDPLGSLDSRRLL